MKKVFSLAASSLVAAALLLPLPLPAADSMEAGFQQPPETAKPLIIWQWMNGVVSREGITADLEAYRRAGLGGVQNFQIGGPNQALADDPSVQIGQPKWRELMRFAMDECARLGLSFGTHNCPGWSSSASPEVRVEDSMQKLVWTETKVAGPARVSLRLPAPPVDARWNYYRDVVVLAVPEQGVIPADKVLDLSSRMQADGTLAWEAPPGSWSILRFGHTTTGMTNENQAPVSGTGLECDKFSQAALERFWQGYPKALLDLAGPRAGTTFTRLEIDSYEAGPQDWTPAMPEEFRQRRGYDLQPWLPALAGKTVRDKALTKRFQRDWKQTLSDLFADRYFLFMDELARRTPGLQLLVEPYFGPFQTPAASGGQSLLAGEFWTKPAKWGQPNLQLVSSAAHTWGKPLVFAEAFTSWPLAAWRDDLYALKPVGDRAFAQGVNLLMLHAGAQNPWRQVKPGMTMGKWGTQFTPGQTWWEHGAAAWLSYLARCQFLLQQGTFAGDVCFLVEDRTKETPPPGYAGDSCGEREFLTRLSVREGRLVLPDGLSYRVLVLPNSQTMALPVARKLRELVQAGAVVLGPKPLRTAGLEGYPACDDEVQKLGEEVWGNGDGKAVQEHAFGKGRVYSGLSLPEVLQRLEVTPDVQFSDASSLSWIHRREQEADLYFISNQKDQPLTVTASFRVGDRVPELWHADTGRRETAPHWQRGVRTETRLELEAGGSVFVVFRRKTDDAGPGLEPAPAPAPAVLEMKGPWEVHFPANWGAPEKVTLDSLISWTNHPLPGVKYFSGTATYTKEVELPPDFGGAGRRVVLDLGAVRNVAEVLVNGRSCEGVLWKPPFRAEIGAALRPGRNHLEVQITNLWPNRMIGDELEPDDAEWGPPFVYSYAPAKPVVGRQLARVPAWLLEGKPRPSQGRYTFGSWKFFTKDSPLEPSGLLGPVKLESTRAGAR